MSLATSTYSWMRRCTLPDLSCSKHAVSRPPDTAVALVRRVLRISARHCSVAISLIAGVAALRLIGLPPDLLRCDMKVEVSYQSITGEITLPKFKPVAG